MIQALHLAVFLASTLFAAAVEYRNVEVLLLNIDTLKINALCTHHEPLKLVLEMRPPTREELVVGGIFRVGVNFGYDSTRELPSLDDIQMPVEPIGSFRLGPCDILRENKYAMKIEADIPTYLPTYKNKKVLGKMEAFVFDKENTSIVGEVEDCGPSGSTDKAFEGVLRCDGDNLVLEDLVLNTVCDLKEWKNFDLEIKIEDLDDKEVMLTPDDLGLKLRQAQLSKTFDVGPDVTRFLGFLEKEKGWPWVKYRPYRVDSESPIKNVTYSSAQLFLKQGDHIIGEKNVTYADIESGGIIIGKGMDCGEDGPKTPSDEPTFILTLDDPTVRTLQAEITDLEKNAQKELMKIVIGVVCAVLAIGVIVFFVRRWYRYLKRKLQQTDSKAKEDGVAATSEGEKLVNI